MNPVLYFIVFAYLAIAIELVVARLQGRTVHEFSDSITSLQLGYLDLMTGFIRGLLAFDIYAATYEGLAVQHLSMSSVTAWLCALVAFDFVYYWAHRLDHSIGIFWAAHAVHHSSEYFNTTTNLRGTSIPSFAHSIILLPLALAGVPPLMFLAIGLLSLVYGTWVHTELIGKLGWLDRVFGTPSNHRVHHGQNDYCIDRNFGTIFVIWDRMFGTYAEERENDPPVYGTRLAVRSYNPAWNNLYVYAAVLLRSWRGRGIWNRIAQLFAPPSGQRGASVEHFDTSSFVRFGSRVRGFRVWIAVIGFIAMNVISIALLIEMPRMTITELALALAALWAVGLGIGAALSVPARQPSHAGVMGGLSEPT